MEANSNPTAPQIITSDNSETQPSQPVHPTLEQKNNIKMTVAVVIVLLLVAAVGAAAFFMGTQQTAQPPVNSPITPEETICTLEAKICPDGSAVGRSGPNCEFSECPSPSASEPISTSGSEVQTFSSKLIVAEGITQVDKYGDSMLGTQANIELQLPTESKIESKQNNHLVTINGITYQVEVNRFAGPCNMEDDGTGCTYEEETAPNAYMLKIWKNNQGKFAINYIEIKVSDYFLNSIFISKPGQDFYLPLSDEEITMWKEIYSTISMVPAS